MDNTLANLVAACLAFVGTHFAMSHPLRAGLVGALGEKGFQGVYSLVSLATFGWIIVAFRAAPTDTPLWAGFGDASWAIGSLVALVAMVLFAGSLMVRNPALPMPGAEAAARAEPAGVLKVTRHPMMWGFALWGVSHLVAAPTARTLVVASTMTFLALVGSHMQDRKKEALMGEAWVGWEGRTSYWPRWGALLSVGAGPWVVGVALWLGLTWAHLPLAGMAAGIWRWFWRGYRSTVIAASSRLFHVSDVHFVEDHAALAWFAEAVRSEAPDAVVCTGDLTQRATHRQYAQAADWFAALGVPVMLQPGNHDMPYYNMWERFRQPYGRYGKLEAAVGSEIALDHALIVPFDTNVRQLRWPWSDGVVRRRKLDATLARLEELRDDPRPKLVACHHPLLPAEDGRRNPTIRGDMAFAALAEAGASAVLAPGHVHRPFDLVRARGNRPLRMIGAGSFRPVCAAQNHRSNVITIDVGGAIAVERRDFERA